MAAVTVTTHSRAETHSVSLRRPAAEVSSAGVKAGGAGLAPPGLRASSFQRCLHPPGSWLHHSGCGFPCHMTCSPALSLPLPPVRTLVMTLGPPGHPGQSHPKILALITAAKPLLPHKEPRSRVPGAGMGHFWATVPHFAYVIRVPPTQGGSPTGAGAQARAPPPC